jgi:alkylated DNA repair protein (DNA oxidative demethylase)
MGATEDPALGRAARRDGTRLHPLELPKGYDGGMARARVEPGLPPGLVYERQFLDVREEQELLGRVVRLRLDPIVIRGRAARRMARHFGLDYDYEARGRLTPGEPLPSWLEPLRGRAGELARVRGEELVETLVQRYPPGSTIGWHRDAPMFGLVVGISLGASCRLRFRRASATERSLREIELQPRSAYVLAGAARWAWQHSIPPTGELRHSVTFRTLRKGGPA